MDYNFWQSFGLFLSLIFVEECGGYPLKPSEAGAAGTAAMAAPLLLSAALLVSMVMVLFGCLCCRQAKGFQEFTDAVSTLDVSAPRAEATPFPPLPNAANAANAANANEPVRFEPLPDIRPRRHAGVKPAPFCEPAAPQPASPRHWFGGEAFPRSRLHYVRELGGGWFGRVVAGQAQGLGPVVVKILREEAAPADQRLFLHQAAPYRDLRHPNVLRMLGACLEAEPLLVLLEDCPRGDLKSCLRESPSFPEHGSSLRLTSDVARGLEHMLQNGYVHTDLAARNCLVTSDLRVKVGDYGNGVDRFEEDYYVAGDVAVPIRWCAPETLDCTDTTIQTKQVSEASNVWSLGVVMWEVAERGRLPYADLTDDEVVGRVIGAGTRLPRPTQPAPNADSLYQLMSRCWSVEASRPGIQQVAAMLDLLCAGPETQDDFQRRWDALPNASGRNVAEPDDRKDFFVLQPLAAELEDQDPVIATKSAADSEPSTAAEDSVSRTEFPAGQRTPSTTSPQPSLASFDFAPGAARSASLTNLRGSLDDLDTRWSEPGTTDYGKRATKSAFDISEEGPDDVFDVAERVLIKPAFDISEQPASKSIFNVYEDGSKRPAFDVSDEAMDRPEEIATGADFNVFEEAATKSANPFERTASKSIFSVYEDGSKRPAFDVSDEAMDRPEETGADFDVSKQAANPFERTATKPASNISEEPAAPRPDLDVSSRSPRPAFDVGSSKSAVRGPMETAEFDSWLRGEAAEGDSLFVREISEAIRDLDDALAREESRDVPMRSADFRLGRLDDAEEEMWRGRIERGEFSQKVKEKSRSVADLMVLTHIESDTSDSDASLTWSFERNSNRASLERGPLRSSLERGSVCASKTSNKRSSIFGSENDLRSTVLGDDFVESLQKIHVARRDSNKNLLSEVASFLREESKASGEVATSFLREENKASGEAATNDGRSFLAIDASEDEGGGGIALSDSIAGVSRKVPVNCATGGVEANTDNTRSVSDGGYGHDSRESLARLGESGSESAESVSKLDEVNEAIWSRAGVFSGVENTSSALDTKESSKAIHVEDNESSTSLDEISSSEAMVTVVASPTDGGEVATGSTLGDDSTSSETSLTLTATSLEYVEEKSSPVRKPVPRPRRSTFGAIEVAAKPEVAARRRSLSLEQRVLDNASIESRKTIAEDAREEFRDDSKTVGGGVYSEVGAELEEDEETKTVREITPEEEVLRSETPGVEMASSDLIEVAKELVDETISKAIESVNETDRRSQRSTKDAPEVNLSADERISTGILAGSSIPQEVCEEITKSVNESNRLSENIKLETTLPSKLLPPAEKQRIDFSESSVILGPCEDFTLDFFKGLKTTFDEQSPIHDWDSLVEESTRAEPLKNDSEDIDIEEYPSWTTFPDLPLDVMVTGSRAIEDQIDYLKFNGFVEEVTIDKELVSDDKIGNVDQLIFAEFDSPPKVTDKIDASNICDKLDIDDQLSFSGWNGFSDDKIDKELILDNQVLTADHLLNNRNSFPDLANKAILLVHDGKTIVDKRLSFNDWNGFAEDVKQEKESVSDAKMAVIDQVAHTESNALSDLANKTDHLVPDGETIEHVAYSEWNGFAKDLKLDKESVLEDNVAVVDELAHTEWNSFPESSDHSTDKSNVEDRPYREWTPYGDASKDDLKVEPFSDWDGKHEDDSKQATPDDERSSDSGFRDKGSLSESCEDEKYHLEDIDAELEAFQRGCNELERDPDVVFDGDFKEDPVESAVNAVEPLDFTFLRGRVEDDAMVDSLEGALAKVERDDLDVTLVDLDKTLTPEAGVGEDDDEGGDIYQAGNGTGNGWFLHPPEPSPERTDGSATLGGQTDFLAALRSELSEKLPNQSAPSDSESDSDSEDEPRRDIVIHYNTYQAPLSPILEETYPESPSSSSFFPRSFEQEVRAALDSLESTASSNSGGGGSVRLEDFDSISRPVTLHATKATPPDDVLQVDVATNEARLLDSPVPGPHLAFAQRREADCRPDETFAIRPANSESPGSGDLSFRTPDASPSRVVEISVGAHDEAAMIIADLNESLRSRSAFHTCSDDYSQASHPSFEVDSSEDYSQSSDSRDLDLSPVQRLDFLTSTRLDPWEKHEDAWEKHMDGDDVWEAEHRALQIAQLGDLLKSREGPTTVAVSPNAASEMKRFVGSSVGHRMEVNGNELRLYETRKDADWLDDIFDVGTPPEKDGSTPSSEYRVAAEEFAEIRDLESTRLAEDDVEDDDVDSLEDGTEFAVGNRSKRDVEGEIVVCVPKGAEEIGAKQAVAKDIDVSTVIETESTNRVGKDVDTGVVKVSETISSDRDKDIRLAEKAASRDETRSAEEKAQTERQSAVDNEEVEKQSAIEVGKAETKSAIEAGKAETQSAIEAGKAETQSAIEAGKAGTRSAVEKPDAEMTSAEAEADEDEESVSKQDEAEEWTSMLAFSPADENHVEMSTSFSAPDDEDEYAPDWETDSSSSGEFTWQEGDMDYADDPRNSVVATPTNDVPRKPYELHEFPMASILEEDEDEDDSSSEGSGAEFVPSAWDSEATPTRSALRSPDKVSEGKKNVTFKRQKYHCVYEYPRDVTEPEVVDTSTDYIGFSDEIQTDYQSFAREEPVDYHNFSRENPVSYATFSKENPVSYASFSKDNPTSYASFTQPASTEVSGLRPVDYASYADWELNDGDGQDQEDEEETEVAVRPPPPTQFDFYKLGTDEFGSGGADDGEFFVSSSSRPFAAFSPSQFAPSQFFPGQCFDSPPSTGETPPASPRSPSGLGELRHTRDRLKLHLPAAAIDAKRATGPDSDDSGVGSSHGAVTPALEV